MKMKTYEAIRKKTHGGTGVCPRNDALTTSPSSKYGASASVRRRSCRSERATAGIYLSARRRTLNCRSEVRAVLAHQGPVVPPPVVPPPVVPLLVVPPPVFPPVVPPPVVPAPVVPPPVVPPPVVPPPVVPPPVVPPPIVPPPPPPPVAPPPPPPVGSGGGLDSMMASLGS